jgi:hypothetical protein
MTLLAPAERNDLAQAFTGAVAPVSLVLVRTDNDGNETALPAQDVVYAYAGPARQAGGVATGAVETLAMVTFYRLAPFNVAVGDRFVLNGQAGVIRRVYAEPVTGVSVAEATLDVGTV